MAATAPVAFPVRMWAVVLVVCFVPSTLTINVLAPDLALAATMLALRDGCEYVSIKVALFPIMTSTRHGRRGPCARVPNYRHNQPPVAGNRHCMGVDFRGGRGLRRPLRATCTSSRSEWLHEDTRWPRMQASQAYFSPSINILAAPGSWVWSQRVEYGSHRDRLSLREVRW